MSEDRKYDAPTDDRKRPDAVGALLRKEKPTACCPRDGEPLVFTFEWAGSEFYCVECEGHFGFLAPRPKPSTPELEARLEELKARYDVERAERAAVQS